MLIVGRLALNDLERVAGVRNIDRSELVLRADTKTCDELEDTYIPFRYG